MSWSYAYTPYVWPTLLPAALLLVLVVYAWRRRTVPAAVPFLLLTLAWVLWALGAALELTAVDPQTKWFWYQSQALFKVCMVTCGLVFVLIYAGLDKWVTRTTLTLLALPCVIILILMVTSLAVPLGWTAVSSGQHVVASTGPIAWVVILYAGLLFLLQIVVLGWLWLRAPLYRWPIALMVGAQALGRAAYLAEVAFGFNPLAPSDAGLLFSIPTIVVYFVALFRFHFFNVVPVGRDTAFERMANGVLILDAEDRIVDLNPAAATVLALARASTIGHPARQILGTHPDLTKLLRQETPASAEIILQRANQPTCFLVQVSPLIHPRGFRLGRLILLQDMTEQKRMRELVTEQQRALAALQERELLGQEVHDSLAQQLAFMNVQAQATHELLRSGQTQRADEYVLKLASVARQAQVDARDMVSGLMTCITPEAGFLPSLRRFLDQFCRTYGIETELSVADAQCFPALAPTVQVQLLRIIQEALTNVRKHAHGQHARLRLNTDDARVEVVIEDDGVGFDPAEMADESGHFGLRIMRERAAAIGGVVDFQSEPGRGTRVAVRFPTSD